MTPGASGDAQSPAPESSVGPEGAELPQGDTALRADAAEETPDDPDSLVHELDEARKSAAFWKGIAYAVAADLERSDGAIASVRQVCRAAIIPPVAELEARLARRVLARLEQPEPKSEARVEQRYRGLAEGLAVELRTAVTAQGQAERERDEARAAVAEAHTALARASTEIAAAKVRLDKSAATHAEHAKAITDLSAELDEARAAVQRVRDLVATEEARDIHQWNVDITGAQHPPRIPTPDILAALDRPEGT